MRALAIHDISCMGKSSATVVIPVLEVLSVETVLIPSALLSTQSDGWDDFYFSDGEEWLEKIYSKIGKCGFDGVYSGFLSSKNEVLTVEKIMSEQCGLKLVDPVLGDSGILYETVTDEHAEAMKGLVSKADIITPNYTEAVILSGKGDGAAIDDIIMSLKSFGPAMGVITSVPGKDGKYFNIAWDESGTESFFFKDAGIAFPGSGDLFASVLFALSLRGFPFFDAVEKATLISSETVSLSMERGRERRMGIWLTAALGKIRDMGLS